VLEPAAPEGDLGEQGFQVPSEGHLVEGLGMEGAVVALAAAERHVDIDQDGPGGGPGRGLLLLGLGRRDFAVQPGHGATISRFISMATKNNRLTHR